VAKEFELKPGEVQIYVTEKEVRGNYSYYEACLKRPEKDPFVYRLYRGTREKAARQAYSRVLSVMLYLEYHVVPQRKERKPELIAEKILVK